MPTTIRPKTYADTYLFSLADENSNKGFSRATVEFVHEADRINPVDPSFKAIADQVKLRQTTSVLYRLLFRKDVVLCVYKKEMPATMKVFCAKDIKYDKKRRVFVDCTNLIKYKNGYWDCKEIDKFCSYLFGAMINLIYYTDMNKITSNSTIIKSSVKCFVKMFTGIMDNLRTINFEENRIKISYIAGVYYLYNMMGKDINYACTSSAASLKISPREVEGYNIYFDPDKDLINIDTLIRCLTDVFHLKDMSTEVFVSRWSFVYGKGTMYGTELLPAYLDILAYAFVGAYLNYQKSIESICRQDMVTVASTLLQVGERAFASGTLSVEAALEEIQSRSEGLTEAQEAILNEKSNLMIKWNSAIQFSTIGTVSSSIVEIGKIKKIVNDIMSADSSDADKLKDLKKLRSNLLRGKTYRKNHSNLIPVVDKAIKEQAYKPLLKVVDDAIAELEEK